MKLLIPTRNRPQSLGTVLAYLERFYPDTQVIVADGSHPDFKDAVAASVGRFQRLAVEFKSYPYEMSFFDRLDDVLRNEREDYVALNADDDYPMVETLRRGEAFLKDNPDYALATGALLSLELTARGELLASLRTARPITHETLEGRIRQYTAWPYPLSYGVCRRQVLINRQRRAQDAVLGELDDLVAGMSDCIDGKVHAIGEVGLILTRNFTQSYLRVDTKLDFLEHGPLIARLARDFAREFVSGGTSEPSATQLATEIFARRVGSYLTGIPYHHQAQFINSNVHRHRFLRHQCDQFERIFKAEAPEHARYRERLLFISRALRETAAAAAGEKGLTPPAGTPAPAVPNVPAPSTGTDTADEDSILPLIGKTLYLDPETMLNVR